MPLDDELTAWSRIRHDWTVLISVKDGDIPEKEWPCHKAALSGLGGYPCEYFIRLFDSQFQENDSQCSKVTFDSAQQAAIFPQFLGYVCGDGISTNIQSAEEWVAFVSVCDYFECSKGITEATAKISDALTTETCVDFFREATFLGQEIVAKKAFEVITKNFYSISHDIQGPLLNLPLRMFSDIVEYVKRDSNVRKKSITVSKYIQANCQGLVHQDLQNLTCREVIPSISVHAAFKLLKLVETHSVSPDLKERCISTVAINWDRISNVEQKVAAVASFELDIYKKRTEVQKEEQAELKRKINSGDELVRKHAAKIKKLETLMGDVVVTGAGDKRFNGYYRKAHWFNDNFESDDDYSDDDIVVDEDDSGRYCLINQTGGYSSLNIELVCAARRRWELRERGTNYTYCNTTGSTVTIPSGGWECSRGGAGGKTPAPTLIIRSTAVPEE